MKKHFQTLGLILLIAALATAYTQLTLPCSIYGDNSRAEMRYADSLKNRPAIMSERLTFNVSLDSMLKPGNDEYRFYSSYYVSISGYITLVKRGDAETCNCHSKDKTDLDTHIELARSAEAKNTETVICEINRFNKNPNLTYEKVLALKGKRVTIDGYLFFDAEHKQNAVNTKPDGTNLWRATCWEVHPVYKITVVQ